MKYIFFTFLCFVIGYTLPSINLSVELVLLGMLLLTIIVIGAFFYSTPLLFEEQPEE